MNSAELPAIVAGDDYPLTLTFRAEGFLEDQTGNSVQLMVKASADDADADALIDRVVNATSPDAENGLIRAPITDMETATLRGLGLVHVQVRRTVASGEKRSPLIATLRVISPPIKDA